jgi:hypothetical protein
MGFNSAFRGLICIESDVLRFKMQNFQLNLEAEAEKFAPYWYKQGSRN